MVYIGIDSLAGTPPFSMACLDDERRLVAISQGPLAEMLAYAAGQAEAIVAISAPPRANQGLVTHQDALPETGIYPASRQTNLRLAEQLLRLKGYHVPLTPSDPVHSQAWMRRGFELYTRLQELGYAAYPGESPRCWLETQIDACFQALIGVPPFPAGTLEGRLQRQLVLRNLHLPVPDPMDFFEEVTRHKLLHGVLPTEKVFPQTELDALMAAQVAWLAAHKPNRLQSFGDPAEGEVFLPLPEPDSRSE